MCLLCTLAISLSDSLYLLHSFVHTSGCSSLDLAIDVTILGRRRSRNRLDRLGSFCLLGRWCRSRCSLSVLHHISIHIGVLQCLSHLLVVLLAHLLRCFLLLGHTLL